MNDRLGDCQRPAILRRPKHIRRIDLFPAPVAQGKLILRIRLQPVKGPCIAVIIFGAQQIIRTTLRVGLRALFPEITAKGNRDPTLLQSGCVLRPKRHRVSLGRVGAPRPLNRDMWLSGVDTLIRYRKQIQLLIIRRAQYPAQTVVRVRLRRPAKRRGRNGRLITVCLVQLHLLPFISVNPFTVRVLLQHLQLQITAACQFFFPAPGDSIRAHEMKRPRLIRRRIHPLQMYAEVVFYGQFLCYRHTANGQRKLTDGTKAFLRHRDIICYFSIR